MEFFPEGYFCIEDFIHPRYSGDFKVFPTPSFNPGEGKIFSTLGHFILGRQEFFPNSFLFFLSINAPVIQYFLINVIFGKNKGCIS